MKLEGGLHKIPLDAVIVRDRHRTHLGDLSDLVASIKAVGLMHPIVLTEDGQLVAGQRRLEAYRALGWTEIPAVVASHLDEAVQLLIAERDENTCRLDMRPSEKVRLGLALEPMELARAKQRKRAGVKAPQDAISAPSGTVPEGSDRSRVRERIGKAVGMGGRTYERAKAIVAALDRADLDEEQRAFVARVVESMDRTGAISQSFDRIAHLLERPTSHQPARSQNGSGPTKRKHYGPKRSPARVREDFMRAYGSVVQACRDAPHIEIPKLDANEARTLASELGRAAKGVGVLRRKILEAANE